MLLTRIIIRIIIFNKCDILKSFSSREIIKILTEDGWYLYETRGDHYQFKHYSKKGKVTVPHPKKNIPMKTVKSIFRQANIDINNF